MRGLLWALPEAESAKEWARLSHSDDVQAFLRLVDAQRQALLEELATAEDNDLRTFLQGQCAALAEVQILGQECHQALTSTQNEEATNDGPGGAREWIRQRVKRFRI